jgi:hypothetical protein
MGFRSVPWHLAIVLLALASSTQAGTAAFDLPGPRVEVRITRAGKTLPISQVPNLQPGDRVWIHPDLPPGQSVNYLLIAAFLRGATNPPPEKWFIKAESWSKQVREEGIVFTIPQDVQQVLLFLAPETGGDFSTLRSTVRGKPGAFVRSSQDLNQASLERSRLDAYLDAVRKTSDTDPAALHERSVLLARSLNVKLDQQCFDKPSEQQASCLTQNTDQLVLEDGHSQSMVWAVLTTGAGSDMIGQLSTSKVAGGGAYSPYVGAIVDLARMLENFHTARYQYIPALAVPKKDELNLKLNNPPSFRNPMSVLVISLPAVEPAQRPPLRPVNPNEIFCLQSPSLVLPVAGAPLVFSTNLAYDFVLQLKNKSGQEINLPATADPARGGFVIDVQKLHAATLDRDISGRLRGYWGFQIFDGPSFDLRNAHSMGWTIPSDDRTALVVGRNNSIHLQSEDASCVEDILVRDEQGKDIKTTWKPLKPGELEVQVPLKNETAGRVTILVRHYGLTEPDRIPLHTYSEVGHLDEFRISAGDRQGILKGTRLDEVASLELGGLHFIPAGLSRADGKDVLRLLAPDADPISPRTSNILIAHVTLNDGRLFDLPATVEPSRPKVMLVRKSIDLGPTSSAIRLGSQDQLPHDGKLSFLLKTEIPQVFPLTERIEVAAENGSFNALLNVDDGSLILEDSQSILAELVPLKSFGPSAFGLLRFRPVQADGRMGDWQPLVTLVRVPSLSEVHCLNNSDKQCTLSGSNIFLIDSIASDAEFVNSVSVPLGFHNATIDVPHPVGGTLYIKLRDDPSVVSMAVPPINSPSTKSPAQGQRKRLTVK